jgi:hypothetical protein
VTADQRPARKRAKVRIGAARPGRGRLCWWECPHCTRRGPEVPVAILAFTAARAASHLRRHHAYLPIPGFQPPGAHRPNAQALAGDPQRPALAA